MMVTFWRVNGTVFKNFPYVELTRLLVHDLYLNCSVLSKDYTLLNLSFSNEFLFWVQDDLFLAWKQIY
jgi:hypothetical protein